VGYDPRTSDAAPIHFAVAVAELSRARIVVASVEAGSPVLPISAAQTVAYATAESDADLVGDCGPALDQVAGDLAARRIAVECRRVRSTSAARGLHGRQSRRAPACWSSAPRGEGGSAASSPDRRRSGS
jgi:hypothetical protein